MVGSGPQEIITELKQNYPEVRADWRGALTAEDIANVMGSVDMLVLPSYMETSPNVIAEAMCAGLPVISTRVGGVPDMIRDGETGLLVDARSIEPLRAAMRCLLDDPRKIRQMGMAARAEARKRYDAGVVAAKTWEAYDRVMEAQHGHAGSFAK